MAQCNQCSNQDLVFKEGTAKTGKNIGKPWKAWYCPPCKNMMFVNQPKAQSYSKPSPAPVQHAGTMQDLTDLVSEIDNKIDLMLKKMGIGPDEMLKVTKTEEEPF